MKIYNKIIIDIESEKIVYEDSFRYSGEIAQCFGGKDDGGGGGDQIITTRYAPYVETRHAEFLNTVAAHRQYLVGTAGVGATMPYNDAQISIPGWDGTMMDYNYRRQLALGATEGSALIHDSPFIDYTFIEVDNAFFGIGYTIANFPSLYDMYGKFMAGLDVDTLYSQIFEDTVNAPEINALVAAEAVLLDDDIEANVIPRFQTGMRDINSVLSSSFVTGKAMIEDTRVKAVAKFSAELKYRMIPVATDRWKTHLEWNKSVVLIYAEVMKLFFSAKMDVDDANYSMVAKHDLWPFTVLDYERAALGALQGATVTDKDVAGSSKAGSAISGALSGAAMGAIAGPAMGMTGGTGALIFGALGLAGGLF